MAWRTNTMVHIGNTGRSQLWPWEGFATAFLMIVVAIFAWWAAAKKAKEWKERERQQRGQGRGTQRDLAKHDHLFDAAIDACARLNRREQALLAEAAGGRSADPLAQMPRPMAATSRRRRPSASRSAPSRAARGRGGAG